MERIAPIELTYKGEKYILDFDKESVKFAEARGFMWDNVARFPVTTIPELFFYAFRKNNPKVARANTDRILEAMGGMTQKLVERLRDLYDQNLECVVCPEDDFDPNGEVTVKF